MQRNSLTKWLSASALAMGLAVLPSALPVSAQAPADPAVPGSTVTSPGTDPVFEAEGDTADDGFDWGLLGLLGLIGLAGLFGRKDSDTHTVPRYRTTDEAPTTTNTPGSRY